MFLVLTVNPRLNRLSVISYIYLACSLERIRSWIDKINVELGWIDYPFLNTNSIPQTWKTGDLNDIRVTWSIPPTWHKRDLKKHTLVSHKYGIKGSQT